MKHFSRTFALFLALVLLLGLAPMTPVAHAANTVSFTMEGTYDYEQAAEVLAIINEARADKGLEPLVADKDLTALAMTRAAELYVYGDSSYRPDGSKWASLLSEYTASAKLSICDLNADAAAFAEECIPVFVSNPKYSSIAIGCFRQNDEIAAWVVLSTNEKTETPFYGRGSVPTEVTINALPSNLGGDILHHYFSNALCACYLIQGTTIGTELQLRNLENSSIVITPSDIDYGYTTTDDSVFTIDNDAHTITAVAPGKAELGITVDGQPINFISTQSSVEVFDTPVLTYEKTDDMISVYYGDFPVSAINDIVLYLRGTKDELWTKCNIEADGTFEHYNLDPTETYTYVVRYWDQWLKGWVNIGEPLVVQLGDAPVVTPEPTPTPTPTPDDSFRLPTEADLPNRASEPTPAEVQLAFARIQADFFPHFTEWSYKTTYQWHGGSFTLANGSSFEGGSDEAAFAMAVSDLIFGRLPAKLDYDMTADDLRPGDIFCDNYGDWYVVKEVSPLYIIVGEIGSYIYPNDVVWDVLYPTSALANRINYVLTRYTSDSPGAAVLSPSIVPSDAKVLANDNRSTYINNIYTSVTNWTLTEDGTLYLEGFGRIGYNDDTWQVYQNQIKRVVFGPKVTGVLQETFANYEALEEVVLGNDINEIYRSTFENCPNLKHIEFGTGLKTIEENAFKYSGLETLTLPDSLESIGDYAFTSCENLKSLYIPASITEWGRNVFTSCNALENLELEDGLTVLGYSAFNHLKTLKIVNIPGSVKTIPKLAFYFSNIETLNIAEGVEIISADAFSYCKQLKNIHLPNTITTIEDSAFRDCENVTDVYFYGTEAQWEKISIGSSNDCLMGSWWSSATIHFVDPNQCFHRNVTVLPAVAPTCEESGLTEGKVCADCGEIVTVQGTIPALGHDYKETIIKEATCVDDGITEYVCKNDPNHFISEFVTPTGKHSYANGVCSVCGAEEPVLPNNPFNDVSDIDYFYAPVLWAVQQGVTGGIGEGLFGPNNGCTRGQVVTFLWAAAGKPEPMRMANPFTDVSERDYYYKAVLWAVENGITGGVGEGLFGPNNTCTRGQIVMFLWRAVGSPAAVNNTNPFTDVTAADYYYNAVLWAVENDVTGGIGEGRFGPNNTCTRGQVVTFLYKVYGSK